MTDPNLIYVIDDDPIFQFGMAKLINNLGVEKNMKFEVKNFLNPEEAISDIGLLKNSNTSLPSYIFLDYNMPQMNGPGCKAELDKLTNEPKIYIITSSIDNDDHTQIKSLNGLKGYMLKPVSLDELKLILN